MDAILARAKTIAAKRRDLTRKRINELAERHKMPDARPRKKRR
jgi:hypothetical protein